MHNPAFSHRIFHVNRAKRLHCGGKYGIILSTCICLGMKFIMPYEVFISFKRNAQDGNGSENT